MRLSSRLSENVTKKLLLPRMDTADTFSTLPSKCASCPGSASSTLTGVFKSTYFLGKMKRPRTRCLCQGHKVFLSWRLQRLLRLLTSTYYVFLSFLVDRDMKDISFCIGQLFLFGRNDVIIMRLSAVIASGFHVVEFFRDFCHKRFGLLLCYVFSVVH